MARRDGLSHYARSFVTSVVSMWRPFGTHAGEFLLQGPDVNNPFTEPGELCTRCVCKANEESLVETLGAIWAHTRAMLGSC